MRFFEHAGVKIEWLGHDAFRINYTKTIYIDPFKISGGEKADFILITHEHFDHCSPEDINKVVKNDTIIFVTPDCLSRMSRYVKDGKTVVVSPGQKIKIATDIILEAVPAYNTNKFRSPGMPFHPKGNDWVGYILHLGKTKIYHAGDTDFIPEMRNIDVDIAMLPVSGTYVMTADEAIRAAKEMKAKYIIPMHYGEVVGSPEDAEKIKNALPNVIILEKV